MIPLLLESFQDAPPGLLLVALALLLTTAAVGVGSIVWSAL